MARRGRVGRTAARTEEVWGRGGGRMNSSPRPPAGSGFGGLGRWSRLSAGRGGAATGCSSWGMWFAYPSDPSACLGTRVADRRPLRLGAWTGSGVADAKGGGGRGAVRRAGRARAPGSVGPLLEEPKERLGRSPLAGSGFGGPLLLSAAPRPAPRPSRASLFPGEAASLGAMPGARAAAAGLERRPASP